MMTVTPEQKSPDDSLPLAGTVLVRESHQYGITVLKPANALARALCDLRGSVTVTPFMVRAFKAMGFTVSTAGESPKTL